MRPHVTKKRKVLGKSLGVVSTDETNAKGKKMVEIGSKQMVLPSKAHILV